MHAGAVRHRETKASTEMRMGLYHANCTAHSSMVATHILRAGTHRPAHRPSLHEPQPHQRERARLRAGFRIQMVADDQCVGRLQPDVALGASDVAPI